MIGVISRLLMCICLFVFSSVNAAIFVGGGVGVTDGAILEAGWKMNPFLSLRGRAGYLPSTSLDSLASGFESGGKSDGFGKIDTLEFNSKTFDLGAEVTPLPMIPFLRGFRFVGALQYMNTGIDTSTKYNGSVNFNGNPYVINGGIDLRTQNKEKYAPYLAIAWDVLNLPIVSARLTAGATQRSFNSHIVRLNGDFSSVNKADIDAEFAKLTKDINKKMWIPSLTLTVRVTLPNAPFIPVI